MAKTCTFQLSEHGFIDLIIVQNVVIIVSAFYFYTHSVSSILAETH